MKKIITSLIVVVLIFNFIFCNFRVYATEGERTEKKSPYLNTASPSNTITAEIIEEGTVSKSQDGATKATLSFGSAGISAIGFVTGILARIVNVLIAIQIDVIMGVLTETQENGTDNQFWFSIERTVFNRVSLFNINFFDTYEKDADPDYSYTVGNGSNQITVKSNDTNNEIKKSIVNVYYICRLLAIILSVLVLIYIGIRMAISSVASDQAKYKKMLISWVESVVLVFVMPYIMVIVFNFGELITNVFYDIEQSVINSGSGIFADSGVFEETIRSEAWSRTF